MDISYLLVRFAKSKNNTIKFFFNPINKNAYESRRR